MFVIFNTVQNNKDANPNTLWEVIKGNIRNTTFRYSSFKQKETHKLETETINIIETLEKQLHETNTNDNETIENEITSKKLVLEGIYQTHLNGIILRARAQHVEHNEKNTKYFANIEKRRSEQKTVHKLVVNGKDITNRTQILEEQRLFFETIYKRKNVENTTLFKKTHHA